jgi:hypothetical protein
MQQSASKTPVVFGENGFLKGRLYIAVKWLLMIAAYAFLVYKLIVFDGYADFAAYWETMQLSRFGWLSAVFLLLPVNWMLEAVKWRLLVSKIQQIGLTEALKAILAGVSTGFFTPNHLGEIVGRIVCLPEGKRKQGFSLSVLSALTQSIVKTIFGIPALILFFVQTQKAITGFHLYIIIVALCLSALTAIYFLTPVIAVRFSGLKTGRKLSGFISFLGEYSFRDLFVTLLLTMLRYLVFCFQFYFMLRFFGVDLDLYQAFPAIASEYLLLMFTPSFAFSEPALRGSYAVFFIGAYSGLTVNIMLAGMGIWVVNMAIVMIAGSVVVVKSKW